jgi:hypothetical protein
MFPVFKSPMVYMNISKSWCHLWKFLVSSFYIVTNHKHPYISFCPDTRFPNTGTILFPDIIVSKNGMFFYHSISGPVFESAKLDFFIHKRKNLFYKMVCASLSVWKSDINVHFSRGLVFNNLKTGLELEWLCEYELDVEITVTIPKLGIWILDIF